jgi:hypothetical protein
LVFTFVIPKRAQATKSLLQKLPAYLSVLVWLIYDFANAIIVAVLALPRYDKTIINHQEILIRNDQISNSWRYATGAKKFGASLKLYTY